MNPEQVEFLLNAAKQYIWWKTPEEALLYPKRILAQIMNIGDWDALCQMTELFKQSDLADVLQSAEIGQFNDRSWNFWGHRLLGSVPPIPRRFVE